MKRYWPMLTLPFLMTGMTGCMSSNTSTVVPKAAETTSNPTAPAGEVENVVVSGFSLPSSIETVPSATSAEESAMRTVSTGKLDDHQGKAVSAIEAPAATSDMEKDKFRLNIWEKNLDEFQIIDQLLFSLKQTKYEDPQFINKGPYGALVRWQEDNKLEKWIIDSKMVTIDGKSVNQINMWVQEDGGLIEAQFNVSAPASTTNRYGEWTVQARMLNEDQSIRGRFAAHTAVDSDGKATIRIEHLNMGDHDYDFKGKLVLKDDVGAGVFRGVFQNEVENLRYSYNTNHLIVQKADSMTCKDRNQYEDFTLDYNVYTADGMNIKNQKRFGFPLRVQGETVSGHEQYLYYGAYHNRHGLYTGNNRELPAEGSVLVRSDNNKNETYRYYGRHKGFFAKKMIKDAKLSDIAFQVLASRTYESFSIRFNDNEKKFYRCEMYNSINCSIPFDTDELRTIPSLKKQVRVYSSQGEINPSDLMPMDGEMFWVNIDHPLYLEFDGVQWSKWSYEFPENSTEWLPNLIEKTPYAFDKTQTLFVHAQDFGFELKVTIENELTLLALKQYSEHIVLPGAEALQAASLLFKDKWSNQEFTFNAESMDLHSMDGTTVTEGRWDLEGSDGATYQWVYPRDDGDNYASIDYLTDENGDFVFLDEAIYFAPFKLDIKHITGLGFDGHMRGLPDYHRLLRDSQGELTDEIKAKIVNIPFGTYFDREDEEKFYFIKPIRGIRVLNPVSAESCSVSPDQTISLDSDSLFKDFVSSEFQDQELKVVEGVIL